MVSEPEQAHQHVITYIFALPGTVQCLHSAGYQRERMRYTQRDLPHFLRACTAHCCGFSTDITMLFLHVPMLLLRYFAPPRHKCLRKFPFSYSIVYSFACEHAQGHAGVYASLRATVYVRANEQALILGVSSRTCFNAELTGSGEDHGDCELIGVVVL
jgi:hypothetical protein